MVAKKTPRKKSAKKSLATRAQTSVRKVAKKATTTASKVTRKTKQVARGAQRVGKVMGVIGNLVEAGGKAAEDLTTQVESGGRKALAQSRKSRGAKSSRKKR